MTSQDPKKGQVERGRCMDMKFLKQNQESWQTEKKISKLSVNILGLI